MHLLDLPIFLTLTTSAVFFVGLVWTRFFEVVDYLVSPESDPFLESRGTIIVAFQVIVAAALHFIGITESEKETVGVMLLSV